MVIRTELDGCPRKEPSLLSHVVGLVTQISCDLFLSDIFFPKDDAHVAYLPDKVIY